MKRMTYNNFMRILHFLQNEKHYAEEEAEHLTRLVFENVEADKGHLNRSAEYFANKILTAEEYYQMLNEA